METNLSASSVEMKLKPKIVYASERLRQKLGKRRRRGREGGEERCDRYLTEAPLHKVVPQFLVHQISLDGRIDVVLWRDCVKDCCAEDRQKVSTRRTCLSATDWPMTR
jgi:hypothetical protein